MTSATRSVQRNVTCPWQPYLCNMTFKVCLPKIKPFMDALKCCGQKPKRWSHWPKLFRETCLRGLNLYKATLKIVLQQWKHFMETFKSWSHWHKLFGETCLHAPQSLQGDIENCSSRMKALHGDVRRLESLTQTLQENLSSRTQSLQGDIENCSSRMKALHGDVEQLQSIDQTLQGNLSAVFSKDTNFRKGL